MLTGCNSSSSSKDKRVSLVNPVYQTAKNSVFLIGSDAAGYQGTAFMVEFKGRNFLVASFHVVSKLNNIFVETEGNVRYRGLEMLAVDRQQDLAILDASKLPRTIPGLKYTHEAKTSQNIYLIGYPAMLSKSDHLNFGVGVISDAEYSASYYMGKGAVDYIQFSTPINMGHSGSPLLNEKAEVIGVVAWHFLPTDSIQGGNYAVPFRHVTVLLLRHDKGKLQPPLANQLTQTCINDEECQWLDFCINGKCQKLKTLSQPCSVNEDCYLPFKCLNDVCTRLGSLGATCQSDRQCYPPNVCILNSCRPLSKRGESCSIDRDCLSPLLCILAKCVTKKSSKNGPCSNYFHCKTPLGCKLGKCLPVAGNSCKSDYECSPLFCIKATCRRLGQQNDSCAASKDCRQPLICIKGSCKDPHNTAGPKTPLRK